MSNSKKIYIIEDQDDFLDLYKAVFRKVKGIEVFAEKTGVEGIELIKNGDPDLVILDYKLPDMDGITICKALREIEDFKELPIVALSSSPLKGNRKEKFSDAGFTVSLEKTLNIKNFRKIILSYL